MIKEDLKMVVIYFINKNYKYLKGTTYGIDLKSMRKKYIYKDISDGEFIKDIQYLRSVKNIFNLP